MSIKSSDSWAGKSNKIFDCFSDMEEFEMEAREDIGIDSDDGVNAFPTQFAEVNTKKEEVKVEDSDEFNRETVSADS